MSRPLTGHTTRRPFPYTVRQLPARRAASRSDRSRPFHWLLLSVAVVLLAGAGCGAPETPVGAPNLPYDAPAGTWSGTPPTAIGSEPAPSGGVPEPLESSSQPRTPARHVFPVDSARASYHKTHSAYPATDIFANCGASFRAVTDGLILEVSRVDLFRKDSPRGPQNGGLFVSLLGDDGVRYYGSHLTTVSAGVEAGVRVRAGQQVGTVGRTGNANNVCHLHFGISPPCTGRDGWWIRRGVIWPAPYLDSWRQDGNRSPAAKVTAWHREHGCPKAP